MPEDEPINPYAPPETESNPRRRLEYVEIDTPTLIGLYHQLRSVISIGSMFLLIAFFSLLLLIFVRPFNNPLWTWIWLSAIPVGGVAAFASLGMALLRPWGRFLGFLMCGLLICVSFIELKVTVPAIVIAVVGFFVLIRSKRLFGREVFRFDLLKRELAHRRRNKVS
ncbi:MAG: hypothetical protein ACI8UO_003095 [Verrucomicrobiales bacterium]|jgi:hypothetical protein